MSAVCLLNYISICSSYFQLW